MFEAKNSPREHGLPFDSWWGHQKDVAVKIMRNIAKGKTTILESPTGSGKSLLPALASKEFSFGATVLVATRDLQQQYQDSFDWFKIVWGQRNYPCVLQERIEHWRALYGEDPTFEECYYPGQYNSCPQHKSCPYLYAKKEAYNAQGKVLNYAYAYYSKWWKEKGNGPGALFCDEAHSLPEIIVGLTSINIGKRAQKAYGLQAFPVVNGSNKRAIETVYKWVCAAKNDVEKWLALAKTFGNADERSRIRASTFLDRLVRIQNLLNPDNVQDDEWYVAYDHRNNRLSIKPVMPMEYANTILTPKAKATVLMSATIGSPEIIASELNIKDYEFISVPHVIPEERRPVWLHPNAPRINAKTGISAYAHQARIIREIFDRHPQEKGIIHTASWSHARTLMALLQDTGRVMLADGPRIETIEKFRNSTGNLVAISPSWDHGLNFQGDDARFGIVAKVPFLPWNDPIVKIRVKSPGGRAWYDWNACLRVVQACGRVVRGMDDWGHNYILDTNWNRVKRFAPEWFKPRKM